MNVKIKKAIIPVAGLGTRMLPATKAIPKELLPIYDRPIIEHVVKEAICAGITEIILVTRSGKEAIENHFDANYELEHRLEKKSNQTILKKVKDIIPDGVKITSIRQNYALGLGHAVLCTKHLINNEPFAVLLPDVFVLDRITRNKNYSFAKLVDKWIDTGIGQVMVEKVEKDVVQDYGIVDIGNQSFSSFDSIRINNLIEKPSIKDAPSNLAVLGRYILPPEILDILVDIKPGFGNEIQLTDALNALIKKQDLNAFVTDAEVYDCGNKIGFMAANLALAIRDKEAKGALKKLLAGLINP
jgi:UTP--glucose-1-phosphate uridylyltransferase